MKLKWLGWKQKKRLKTPPRDKTHV